MAETIAPATKAFITDLREIASAQATSGNYQDAASTKFKATTTLAFLESLKISSSSARILPLAEASHTGSVAYAADTETLGRFINENARASWKLRQIRPGTYDVLLTYSANHRIKENRSSKNEIHAGGTLQLREDTKLQRSDSSANSITYEITSTGGWDAYRTEIIGSIALASSSATITLEALAPKPQGLIQLRQIRLIPQSPPPLANETTTKNLASLKRQHETRSAPILAPLISAHSAELISIKNAANAAGDTKATRRATEALRKFRNSTGKTIPSAPSLPPITLPAVDDLKVQLAGNTTPNASRSHLTHLSPGGEAAITWQFPSEHPDTRFYEVSIRQRPTLSSGGRLALTSGKNEISYYLPRPKEKYIKNATFENTPLGTLEIPPSAAAIQLRILSLDPDANTLADLESLILQPLSDELAAKDAIAQQDSANHQYIENATKGWKTIKGATYSPSDTARASQFQITTASGETRKITLYGIKSPRLTHSESVKDLEAIKVARWKFKLDQADLERAGRKALKLVEATLASGNCTLFTHGDTNDDSTFAIITTPEGIPLSIALATAGFATKSYHYGNHTFPRTIHPDLRPEVYARWIESAIREAKRSRKGLWEKTR